VPRRRHVRIPTWTDTAFWALFGLVAAIGLWNAAHFPPGQGYDAADHMDYADGLIPGWHLPHGVGEYYTPPGFYFVAGILDWLAEQAGVGEPHRAAQLLNVVLLLGTLLLVRQIARELWPRRARMELGAVAFVAFVPVTVKTTAMFHPEVLSLFVSTLALWLCVRTFRDARWVWALGVSLGAVQLVRAWGLLTVGAILLALLAARRWRDFGIALVLAAVIAAPWYVHQRLEYGGSPAFPQDTTEQAHHDSGAVKPIWQRRPLRFYVDPGVPAVITTPWREHFLNLAIPTTYTEIWGDYFGVWSWQGDPPPPESQQGELQLQSVIGLLPTLVAVAGWLLLLLASLRSPPRLALALLPLLAIVGYLYFTVSYPTPDGDVLKGTYMLTAVVGWGFGFAYALERLRGNWFTFVAALLGLCALVQLPFLFY
jgi:4-amino-4-deoxy-L-arabinose transferase-like glycosyltransferase